jgi:TatD DNase family protein
LIHEQFAGEEDAIAIKCKNIGLDHIIVNGLEPISNRQILEYSKNHSNILPALGIYPIDAMNQVLSDSLWNDLNLGFPPPVKFNVDDEIEFIRGKAASREIIALGECGLDRYYVDSKITNDEQERVLRELMRIAKSNNLPIILHTRKAEERVLEMLIEEGVEKADFHCFGGKVRDV